MLPLRISYLKKRKGNNFTALYDGIGFDETMSLALDASGYRDASYGRQGASGLYDGKYRYEGPTSGVALGTVFKTLSAERMSLSVKGLSIGYTS